VQLGLGDTTLEERLSERTQCLRRRWIVGLAGVTRHDDCVPAVARKRFRRLLDGRRSPARRDGEIGQLDDIAQLDERFEFVNGEAWHRERRMLNQAAMHTGLPGGSEEREGLSAIEVAGRHQRLVFGGETQNLTCGIDQHGVVVEQLDSRG
jgi:hypothetical protein